MPTSLGKTESEKNGVGLGGLGGGGYIKGSISSAAKPLEGVGVSDDLRVKYHGKVGGRTNRPSS